MHRPLLLDDRLASPPNNSNTPDHAHDGAHAIAPSSRHSIIPDIFLPDRAGGCPRILKACIPIYAISVAFSIILVGVFIACVFENTDPVSSLVVDVNYGIYSMLSGLFVVTFFAWGYAWNIMMFVRYRINFPLALFSISEQQLCKLRMDDGGVSDSDSDCHSVNGNFGSQWGHSHTGMPSEHEHSMQVHTAASVDCITSSTIASPHHTCTPSHGSAVSTPDDPRITRRPLPPQPSSSRHRVLSSFGICRITAWLAVLQTTTAFVLISYCWRTPNSPILHPYFGAIVMLSIFTLHVLFVFWPYKMEADSRGTLRRSLQRCFMSGWVKYRLLDNPSLRDLFVQVVCEFMCSMQIALLRIEVGVCALITGAWWDPLFIDTSFASTEPHSSVVDSVCRVSSPLQNIICPIVFSLPFALRALQCYRQYMFPSEGGWGSATDAPWNRNRHIFNICKYLSAIFVVVFDALQGSVRSGDHFDISELLKPSFFQGMWILSVVVKTASNIYWDHTQEWGRFASPGLAFPPWKYRVITVANAILRCAWTLGISPNAGYSEAFALLLQVLEVFRRTLWVFPRIEWFCISKRMQPASLRANRYFVEA